jgi:DNA-binding MarR family transcriptional regulator
LVGNGKALSAHDLVTGDIPHSPEQIRALIARSALASTRHRAAAARLLGLTDTDLLAVQHLSREGRATPTRLRELLGMTSGGTTGLIQRLERFGHVVREPHPTDHRSAILRLTREVEVVAGEAFAPLVHDLEMAAEELSDRERLIVAAFLDRVAHAAERRADELTLRAERERRSLPGVPVPGLWA